MSIPIKISAASGIDRTVALNISTPLGESPTVTIQREKVLYDDQNAIVGKAFSSRVATRIDAGEAARTITVGELTLTVGQVSAFVAKYADMKASGQ